MVQRCSNGLAFLVLEPEPSVRTGIRVDIFEGDNPLSLIARLPLTWGRRWTDPLKGTGSGEFWIHADDETLAANPGLLAYGNIARFSLDERYRFAIQIEHLDRVQVEADGDVSRTIKVSGRGVLSKLEEAVLYPAGGLAGDPVRTFTDANADDLLGAAFDEAQTRGALAGLTRDFTASADSNNAPYDVALTVEERAGVSVLRIGERLGELAGDLYMTPAGVLKFVNQRGVDRSQQLPDAGPVILRPADNLEELTRSEDGQVRNLLLIETPGGFLERTEGGSVSTYGRREAFLSLGNISDNDAIDRAASAVFASSADPAAEIGTRVLDKDGARPYVDWGVGDWVLAPDENGDLERHRVRALTVSEDDEGEPQFVPELATITEELETRLERWLAAMEKGTVGGTAAGVAEPVKAPVEVVDAIDAGLGDHLAAQPHHDELADLADTDVTGLADDDVLRYNSGSGAWEPEALSLDALDDVDVTSTPPTDGQVLKYDDGSGLWLPAADETGGAGGGASRTLLASGTLGSDGPILVTDIPQTHTELLLVLLGRSAGAGIAGDNFRLRFGPAAGLDTGNNYSWVFTEEGTNNATANAGDTNEIGPTSGFGSPLTAANADSGKLGLATVRIPLYAETGIDRHVTMEGGRRSQSGNRRRFVAWAEWASTDPLEQLQVRAGQVTNLAAGSKYWLYGID